MTTYKLMQQVELCDGSHEWVQVRIYSLLSNALKDYSKFTKFDSTILGILKVTEEELDVSNNELGMEI